MDNSAEDANKYHKEVKQEGSYNCLLFCYNSLILCHWVKALGIGFLFLVFCLRLKSHKRGSVLTPKETPPPLFCSWGWCCAAVMLILFLNPRLSNSCLTTVGSGWEMKQTQRRTDRSLYSQGRLQIQMDLFTPLVNGQQMTWRLKKGISDHGGGWGGVRG